MVYTHVQRHAPRAHTHTRTATHTHNRTCVHTHIQTAHTHTRTHTNPTLYTRYCMFEGSVLHGVIPGRGFVPEGAQGRRVTFMVAFWEDIKATVWSRFSLHSRLAPRFISFPFAYLHVGNLLYSDLTVALASGDKRSAYVVRHLPHIHIQTHTHTRTPTHPHTHIPPPTHTKTPTHPHRPTRTALLAPRSPSPTRARPHGS